MSNGSRIAWLSRPVQRLVRGALEETGAQVVLNEVDKLTVESKKAGGGSKSRWDGIWRVDAKSCSCGAICIHDLDARIPAKGLEGEETFLSTGIPDSAVPRVSSSCKDEAEGFRLGDLAPEQSSRSCSEACSRSRSGILHQGSWRSMLDRWLLALPFRGLPPLVRFYSCDIPVALSLNYQCGLLFVRKAFMCRRSFPT